MTRDNNINNKGEIYSSIPGAVALASIIVMTSGAHGVLGAFLSYGPTLEGLVYLVYGIFMLTLGYRLLFLEKWTYWASLVVFLLAFLNAVSDILLVFIGMSSADGMPVSQIVILVVAIIFVIAFILSSVRDAFGVKRFI